MIRTLRSRAARPADRLIAVVVLPTPPFWLATATTRLIGRHYQPGSTWNTPRPGERGRLGVDATRGWAGPSRAETGAGERRRVGRPRWSRRAGPLRVGSENRP